MEDYEIHYSKIKNVYIQIKDSKVIIKAPKNISKKDLNNIIKEKEDWIKKNIEKSKNKIEREDLYSKDEFRQIVEDIVRKLVLETKLLPNKVRIRKIKYAWGTCSKNRNITISYNLIKYDKETIRYVILHELCHLKYMNHSKDFWNLVETYMPNYKKIRKELK